MGYRNFPYGFAEFFTDSAEQLLQFVHSRSIVKEAVQGLPGIIQPDRFAAVSQLNLLLAYHIYHILLQF